MKHVTQQPVGLPDKQKTKSSDVQLLAGTSDFYPLGIKPLEYASKEFTKTGMKLPDPYLPMVKSGDYEITYSDHKSGEKLDVIDLRIAMFSGLPLKSMTLDRDWKEMVLLNKGNRSSSTHPTEVISVKYVIDNARGHVLVSGLGVGLALHFLTVSQKVQSITCVEADQVLIHLLADHFPKVTFVNEEPLHFMEDEQNRNRFDFVYLDVDNDSQGHFYDQAAPQLKAAKNVLRSNSKRCDLVCWHEELMRGQVIANIIQAINNGYDPRTESAESLNRKRRYMAADIDFFERYSAVKPSRASAKLVNEFVWQWEPSESSK